MKEISFDEAKKKYCKGETIYLGDWKIPESYMFGSHASAESLFYRCIEGKNLEDGFFIKA